MITDNKQYKVIIKLKKYLKINKLEYKMVPIILTQILINKTTLLKLQLIVRIYKEIYMKIVNKLKMMCMVINPF